MKEIKLYNVIFPIWLLLFFPPVIFITLAGNFVIDSLVILFCYNIYKKSNMQYTMKVFYRKSIIKVWLFGFLADIIGASILFFLGILGDSVGIPYELASAINYDPFSNPIAVLIITLSILVSSIFIFLFNYKFTFRRIILENKIRFKVPIFIAIATMPWTFLLPTKWFYY